MRRFIYLSLGFLLAAVTNLHAQDKEKNNLESLEIGGQDSLEAFAQMPIYNPKRADAKILLFKPEGWISNMPIVGNEDSLSEKLLPNLSKNPLKNIPSYIYKNQESDSTQKK